jgi:hypothetical protein
MSQPKMPASQRIRPVLTPEDDPWLFAAEELEKSPSRYAGIPKEREAASYESATVYIRESASEMQLPALTVAVAATFMRRFYMLESITDHNTAHVASACLFLACKVSETHKRLRDFIHHTVAVRTRDLRVGLEGQDVFEGNGNDGFEEEKAAMLKMEAEVMRILNFDLTVDQPFSHLTPLLDHYLKTLEAADLSPEDNGRRRREAMQTAWNFLVESIGMYIHVRFDAREIATAAIFLGVRFQGMPIQGPNPGSPLYCDLYSCDVAHIEEICNALLDAADPDASFS